MTGDRPVFAVGGGGGVLPLAFDFRPIAAFYRARRLTQPTSTLVAISKFEDLRI
jgi:hypothetical protein